jgi:hypothetical protein
MTALSGQGSETYSYFREVELWTSMSSGQIVIRREYLEIYGVRHRLITSAVWMQQVTRSADSAVGLKSRQQRARRGIDRDRIKVRYTVVDARSADKLVNNLAPGIHCRSTLAGKDAIQTRGNGAADDFNAPSVKTLHHVLQAGNDVARGGVAGT